MDVMSKAGAPSTARHIYRVDKFVVPESARDEFVGKVGQTHALLRAQPGFVRDYVLEQSSGPGEFNFVTFVEWESADVVDTVRAAVSAFHESTNFDPQEMFARLDIKADVAIYRRVFD
jgi:heme-degrading monooxygenase HmoA